MSDPNLLLSKVFEGWEGYHQSILHSVQSLASEQLNWKPSPNLRTTGELVAHIALGRLGWFIRLSAQGSQELFQQAMAMGWEPAIASNKDEIIRWLELSWQVIAQSLSQWTVDDLWRSFEMEYQDVKYRVTYQWVIWRILAHDIHHGGELAVMLGMQGVPIFELGDLGGHLTMPPRAN